MRAVYAETGAEVRALDVALEEIADCRIRIALLHYSPTTTTLAGERQTIWSFLGSDRLAEPISRHVPTMVARPRPRGTFEGFIGPVPVFNVAVRDGRRLLGVRVRRGGSSAPQAQRAGARAARGAARGDVIRRLGPGDEAVLAVLAADEEDFDLAERSGPKPVAGADAAAYLSDPNVLHWVAEDDGVVVGHLLAYLERRRAGEARQVLLYEIGVREAYRRHGIGRALVEAMRTWMRDHDAAGRQRRRRSVLRGVRVRPRRRPAGADDADALARACDTGHDASRASAGLEPTTRLLEPASAGRARDRAR